MSGFGLIAALLFRLGATERTRFAFLVEKWILARTGAGKFPVFFHQDFDGNSRESNREQSDGQGDYFPFHAAKVRVNQWIHGYELGRLCEKIRKFC